MSLLIVDSSIAAKWYFTEIHSDAAQRAISGRYELHAPDIVQLEMDNIILKHLYNALTNSPYSRHVVWVEDIP